MLERADVFYEYKLLLRGKTSKWSKTQTFEVNVRQVGTATSSSSNAGVGNY